MVERELMLTEIQDDNSEWFNDSLLARNISGVLDYSHIDRLVFTLFIVLSANKIFVFVYTHLLISFDIITS